MLFSAEESDEKQCIKVFMIRYLDMCAVMKVKSASRQFSYREQSYGYVFGISTWKTFKSYTNCNNYLLCPSLFGNQINAKNISARENIYISYKDKSLEN